MSKSKTIHELLYQKLKNEYDAFCNHLKTLSVEKIIQSSYEKVFKENILMCFEDDFLSCGEAKKLYCVDNLLDKLYNEWLTTNDNCMDLLRDMVSDYLNEGMNNNND